MKFDFHFKKIPVKPEIELVTLTMTEQEARSLYKILGESHVAGSYLLYKTVGDKFNDYDGEDEE